MGWTPVHDANGDVVRMVWVDEEQAPMTKSKHNKRPTVVIRRCKRCRVSVPKERLFGGLCTSCQLQSLGPSLFEPQD